MRSIPPDHSPGARRMVQLAASLAPPWSVLRDAALRAAPQDEGGLGLTKWPRGRRNPLKRLDSRKGKSLNFASPGLDFPSLRLGFSFRRIWIFLPGLGWAPRGGGQNAPMRIRSWKCTIPTTWPRSTTRSAEILWLIAC